MLRESSGKRQASTFVAFLSRIYSVSSTKAASSRTGLGFRVWFQTSGVLRGLCCEWRLDGRGRGFCCAGFAVNGFLATGAGGVSLVRVRRGSAGFGRGQFQGGGVCCCGVLRGARGLRAAGSARLRAARSAGFGHFGCAAWAGGVCGFAQAPFCRGVSWRAVSPLRDSSAGFQSFQREVSEFPA